MHPGALYANLAPQTVAGSKGGERRFYIVWRGSLTIVKPTPEEQDTNFLEHPLEVAGYYKPGTVYLAYKLPTSII